jgi:hypothetical protein
MGVDVSAEQLRGLDERMESSSGADPSRSVDTKAVLEELFALLEEYGPSWYTEDHHNRAIVALDDHSKSITPQPVLRAVQATTGKLTLGISLGTH